MEHPESIEDIKVKLESYVDVKEEQPDSPEARENVLDFEEDVIYFIKPEIGSPIEPDVERVEEDEKKVEFKDFTILVTKFVDFFCVICDGVLDVTGPMPVCKHNKEIVLICKECKHPKGNNFACVKCDRGFLLKQSLINHVNAIHRKLKKYKCGECDSAFAQAKHLKVRVNSIHRKEKYTCQECKKVISRRDILNAHVNFVHRQLGVLTCRECSGAFSTQLQLKRHINGVHRGMKEHSCEECESAFFNRVGKPNKTYQFGTPKTDTI